MSPFRVGFVYGTVAVVVALVADLRFLYIDPQGIPDWILTVVEGFRTQLALAAFLFLGVLAALRTRPVRNDPDVPYRSLLLRDCALASAIVAVMAGVTLFVVTALSATLFADEIRDYARDAAPSIVAYNEKVAGRVSDPPPIPSVSEIEAGLQPPALRDLGRSMANLVLRAILLGTVGALVGFLRGSLGSGEAGRDPARDPARDAALVEKEGSSSNGKSLEG